MTDHANELRRYARKIAHPAGDVPSVMLAAADEIERLAARLKAAEKERDSAMKLADSLALALNTSNHERDNLRAKIEAMERQEPVGEIQRANSTGNYNNSVVWVPMVVGSKLYALPGAKGEEK